MREGGRARGEQRSRQKRRERKGGGEGKERGEAESRKRFEGGDAIRSSGFIFAAQIPRTGMKHQGGSRAARGVGA